VFGNKWIGRGGLSHGLPGLLSLIPWICFGLFKIFALPVENIEDLRERIVAGCEVIKQNLM
jgi:cyanate permease